MRSCYLVGTPAWWFPWSSGTRTCQKHSLKWAGRLWESCFSLFFLPFHNDWHHNQAGCKAWTVAHTQHSAVAAAATTSNDSFKHSSSCSGLSGFILIISFLLKVLEDDDNEKKAADRRRMRTTMVWINHEWRRRRSDLGSLRCTNIKGTRAESCDSAPKDQGPSKHLAKDAGLNPAPTRAALTHNSCQGNVETLLCRRCWLKEKKNQRVKRSELLKGALSTGNGA